jgi:hypothetical protein
MPWLKLRFHVPPDARFRTGASGIADLLVKSRTERCLRPGQNLPSQSLAARLSIFTSRDY